MGEPIICTKCKTENPPGTLYCQRCGGTLRKLTLEEQALTTLARQATERPEPSGAGLALAAVGLLGTAGVAWWVVWTMGRAHAAAAGLSAVQVSQLYTQGAFWALVVVALLLAGILVVLSTRR